MRKIFLMAVLLAVFGMAVNAMAAETIHTNDTTGYACGTCHLAHNADPNSFSSAVPLWAGNDPSYTSGSFIMYETKVFTTDTEILGDSRICLSCHDGSSTFDSGKIVIADNASNLGTNLLNMHPISFVYSQNVSAGYLETATDLQALGLLDASYRVGCPSCHAIHRGSAGDKALRYGSTSDSVLCNACHQK